MALPPSRSSGSTTERENNCRVIPLITSGQRHRRFRRYQYALSHFPVHRLLTFELRIKLFFIDLWVCFIFQINLMRNYNDLIPFKAKSLNITNIFPCIAQSISEDSYGLFSVEIIILKILHYGLLVARSLVPPFLAPKFGVVVGTYK